MYETKPYIPKPKVIDYVSFNGEKIILKKLNDKDLVKLLNIYIKKYNKNEIDKKEFFEYLIDQNLDIKGMKNKIYNLSKNICNKLKLYK